MIKQLSRSAAAAMTSIPVAANVMSAPMHARAMLNDTSFMITRNLQPDALRADIQCH